MSDASDDESQISAIKSSLRHMRTWGTTIQGDVNTENIYDRGDRRVVQHVTSKGKLLAIKSLCPPRRDETILAIRGSSLPSRGDGDLEPDAERSEAAMVHYASTHGIAVPAVHGVYDIVPWRAGKPSHIALVTDMAPGVSLDKVWHELNPAEQEGVKNQLHHQLQRMRECTLPYIGRPDDMPVYNIYDRVAPHWAGPWQDEENFDDWCLARIPEGCTGLTRMRWERWLQKERQHHPKKFILTHGDLSPKNIMFHEGKVTGIVDWERSGFYPEYAEFAFAMCFGQSTEKWWLPVLAEVLQPCSKKRLKFTKLAEQRTW